MSAPVSKTIHLGYSSSEPYYHVHARVDGIDDDRQSKHTNNRERALSWITELKGRGFTLIPGFQSLRDAWDAGNDY